MRPSPCFLLSVVGLATALVVPPTPLPRAHVLRVARHPPPSLREVELTAFLDDKKTEALFAWLCRAFAGDRRYNDLSLAFAGVFGDIPELQPLVDEAISLLPAEDEPVGEPVSLREREQGSLGAMGAGQWTGQFRTRPHALLDVRELRDVDEWARSLSRGQRRTLAKAEAQEWAVRSLPIRGGEPAPHSTLAHFRCVVDHEVRLLAETPNDFFDALAQAIGRYQNCVRQAGEIREYRAADGRVLAFAQEATKGKVIRGQWFYATDTAAKSYVWFHSVQELVRRAIADDGVDFADLGPSGSDGFTALKEKYGFAAVSDWHRVADYRGPFRYSWGAGEGWDRLDPPDWLFEERNVLDKVMAELERRSS